MAMAVSCAHLNVLGPSVIATQVKSCTCSNAPSLSFRLLRKSYGGRSRSIVCQASGSRREKEKRRGDSNGKSKKGDDAKLDEKLMAINDDSEYEYEEIIVVDEVEEEYDDEETSYDEEKSLGDRTAETAGAVADVAGVSRDDPSVVRAETSGKRVGDELGDIGEEGQESARAVAGDARDAADASGQRVQRAGRRVGQNLEEVRKAGEAAVGGSAEVVNAQAERAADNIQQGVEEAGDTARDVAGIVEENAEVAGRRLRETGSRITDDLQSVGKEGQKVASQAGEAVSKQAREASKELGQEARRVERGAERAVRSTVRRAQESADRVQEPIEKAVNASIDAAAAIGNEVFKLSDSIIEAVEEATGMTAPGKRSSYAVRSERKSESQKPDDEGEELVGGKYKPAGKSVVKRYQGVREDGDDDSQQEADGPFTELTVLVAGAAGATGRLIVQDLVGKGATVRALVRNVYRARNLKQLQGAELFEADLYNYESVKEAISGCNVVISAVGTRGFDLLQAYRTEYEGVLNLISVAKNQGDMKKFVLITTIGVNSVLQVVPLLYWKRQAELFLQRSGLDYTIVRPAGLTGDRGGVVELRPADSLFMGAVSRKKVAEVCISAIVTPSASDKTVEVVGGSGRVKRSIADQFESI